MSDMRLVVVGALGAVVAVAMNGGVTLNLAKLDGENSHHIAEATFKAFARALREAVEPDPRSAGIPSTKGTLSE